ncbi:hypothetical protein GCM10017691_06160 [Pseudonocardia petroleophila]
MLVTVEPASTAKLAAVPSGTEVAACAVPAASSIREVTSRAVVAVRAAPIRVRLVPEGGTGRVIDGTSSPGRVRPAPSGACRGWGPGRCPDEDGGAAACGARAQGRVARTRGTGGRDVASSPPPSGDDL